MAIVVSISRAVFEKNCSRRFSRRREKLLWEKLYHFARKVINLASFILRAGDFKGHGKILLKNVRKTTLYFDYAGEDSNKKKLLLISAILQRASLKSGNS